MKVRKKFKKGAASFYVVAFSTLILMILATSFVAVIVSEMTRTSNDDLSQSAYDSAMAGVEDAKLAFYNYQNCKQKEEEGEMGESCREIIEFMESDDCDMVQKILGRGSGGGVVIEESSNVGNNMQQAYTCVTMRKSLGDYRATLSSANMIDVIKTKFDGISANDVRKVKISWYRNEEKTLRYSSPGTNNVSFDLARSAPTPPVMSLAMIQTAPEFDFADFDVTRGDKTDRGMVYLVPSDKKDIAKNTNDAYIGAYDDAKNKNIIRDDGFLRSNDKTAASPNLPYLVYCDDDGEFMCSATIDIPEPIGGVRNDDTFVFVVGLPYGKPETDFSVEFYCADGASCVPDKYKDEAGSSSQAYMDGVQIQIDSTGRANDLFRRLEVRLKDSSDSVLSIMGPLELLSSNTSMALEKDFRVTKEWNFSN